MRPRSVIPCLVLLIGLLTTRYSEAQSAYQPKDAKLYATILHMDSVMFDAFNNHDLNTLKSVFADSLEFYNDGGGMTDYNTTIANFAAMFGRNKNTGLKRELVKGSLEVYPVPGSGAIEIGTHRFIHTENGKEEIGIMKFIHIWQYKDGLWKATRVISVGH